MHFDKCEDLKVSGINISKECNKIGEKAITSE